MSFATTDLSDEYPELEVCDPVFRDFGGRRGFHGPVRTLKLFEDNSLVRKALETPGEGGVLVVDGGGSKRCALLGDRLGELAVRNGWAGIVIYGCIRDSEALARLDVGVKALATHPRKSEKRNSGQADVPVQFAGVCIRPGDYLYADADGVVIASKALKS